MSEPDEIERRSEELEDIRSSLRRQIDTCLRMKARSSFQIKHEAKILLSPSEQTAMRKQIKEYRGHEIKVSVSFDTKKRRRKPHTTTIAVQASRKRSFSVR